MNPTEVSKRCKLEPYHAYPEETSALTDKINSCVPAVRAGMTALMNEVATRAAILEPALETYASADANARVQLMTVLQYLQKALCDEGGDNAIWKLLRAAVKPLTTALNAMAKYLYAYKVIRGIEITNAEVLRVFFCWAPYEMETLYVLEFLNFTRVMKQSEDAWFERGEATVFDLTSSRSCLVAYGFVDLLQYERTVHARQAKRYSDFVEAYPRPVLQGASESAIARAWCSSFMAASESVVAFDQALAALSPAWTNACRTIVDAAGQATVDVNTISLATLATVNVDTFAAQLYDFWAPYAHLATYPPALRAAVLKEYRLPAMLRVLCASLQRHGARVPVWIVELAAMHKSQAQLQLLRDELRGTVPATWIDAAMVKN